MMNYKLGLLFALLAISAHANDFSMHYSAGIDINGGPNNFAPYYISALRNGKITSARGATLSVNAWKPLDKSKRFSYSFGVEAAAQIANNVDYRRFDVNNSTWFSHSENTPRLWLHQLWGEVKYRGVFLWVGMRDFTPALVNPRLSSGDLIESGNARNIPGGRIGFIDFQNIPFTNGWVQIQGEIGYGKATDNDWQKNHYNYYNEHLNLGWWYNYKRCFFRTKPSQPFSITVGMQAAAQFAGETWWYRNGIAYRYSDKALGIRDFIDMLIIRQGDDYWKGNHVGSWDFQARYRLKNNNEIKAYFQWPWEDGSGIGKLNGMDGLWGIEWVSAKKGFVTGAVVEFMSYMNQSGPIHYASADHAGTNMVGHSAEGRDSYYNNYWYNGYAHYGMSIGSPMFISPLYNLNGASTTFMNNRFWGIHAAVEGLVLPELSYRLMASYRRFYGTLEIPSLTIGSCVSAFLETSWNVTTIPGLQINAQIAMDCGNSQYGRNFGALLSVKYSGIFNFKTRKSSPCVL